MRSVWRSIWPYLWRYRPSFLRGMAALLTKDLLSAVMPLLIGRGVDSLTRGFRLETVLWFAAALAAIAALKGLFQYWMRVILIGVSRDVEYDIRNDLYAKLTDLAPDFYSRYRTGDIMARATNDLNNVRMMLGPGLMYWSETMLTFVLAIAVMSAADWRLTVTALAPAPLVSIVVIFFGRRIHARAERVQQMFGDISSRVQENLSGVRVIRAYVQEQAEIDRFEALNRDYIVQNLALARLSGLFSPLLQALIGLTFLVVLWAGGYGVLSGRITIGNFVMFNTYMGTLVWPMIALGWVVNLMQRGTASWQRLEQLMSETPSIAPPEQPRDWPEPRHGEIEFRQVNLEYARGAKALDGVDLRIPGGATVAIVGHTGSGKSTLVQLVPRLIDPTSGVVLIDGIDVREMDPATARREIGFVPQETFLFSATLRENIAFGVKEASDEQVRWAADVAGLGPDLAGFPQGLDTVVGERGLTLSGGQKQRTAIARAILRNPRILILDDALSSVDTLTEERILTELASVMRDRTTILISHRVSTVRHADTIFVLEHGRIVEQGTHDELLALGGYYADLHQRQLLEEALEST